MKTQSPTDVAFGQNASEFDPRRAEHIATSEGTLDANSAHEEITHSLYVTEQRRFYLVDQFYSFDGRLATNTRQLTVGQARAWCDACGLDARLVERYVAQAPVERAAWPSVPLLSRPWVPTGS